MSRRHLKSSKCHERLSPSALYLPKEPLIHPKGLNYPKALRQPGQPVGLVTGSRAKAVANARPASCTLSDLLPFLLKVPSPFLQITSCLRRGRHPRPLPPLRWRSILGSTAPQGGPRLPWAPRAPPCGTRAEDSRLFSSGSSSVFAGVSATSLGGWRAIIFPPCRRNRGVPQSWGSCGSSMAAAVES